MQQQLQRLVLLLTMGLSVALPVSASEPVSEELDIPVTANSKETYQFVIQSQSGYTDERGRNVIDVIEGYNVNLALSVDTKAGQPVIGLEPKFDLDGTSMLIPPGESTPLTSTDESGILEFGLTAGKQGMDKLTVSFGENEATVYFNIISLRINDFAAAPTLDGGLNWNELMQTTLSFKDGELNIDFPEVIQQQDGETVRISGFMMPLDSGLKQKHFLLTSAPPHCFFHIPGGPAGVIEVFSEDGIEASWDPVAITGQFQLITNPEMGVIYQMQQAEVVEDTPALPGPNWLN